MKVKDTIQELSNVIDNLKSFINEQKKLKTIIEVISPTSTGVVEFGGKFIDDYIKLAEKAFGDTQRWIDWYIWENDFGNKKMQVKLGKKEFKVVNVGQLFECIEYYWEKEKE